MFEKEKKSLVKKFVKSPDSMTIEDCMMLYYSRPCQRIIPESDNFYTKHLLVERGSVIIRSEIVLIFCHAIDYHLCPPVLDHGFVICESAPGFQNGTRIIRNKGSYVTYYCDDGIESFRRNRIEPSEFLLSLFNGQVIGYSDVPKIRKLPFTMAKYSHTRVSHDIYKCWEELNIQNGINEIS